MTVNMSRVSAGLAAAAVIASFGIIATAQARIPVEPGGQVKKGSSQSTYFSGGHPLNGNTHVRRPFDTDPD